MHLPTSVAISSPGVSRSAERLTFIVLALLAVAPAASAASFKFATQTLTVPDGFTVEQVAAPPLVDRPISIAFDPEGRLYVTDSSGLSDRAPVQFEKKPHRVLRLEDTDGDGVFDRRTVFAENMMFPQGALFYEGSLYVGAPPHIWKLTDTNNDGVADERTAWYDGKTLTGCANDLHGPYLGHDGWFYWTKGAFAEQTHTLSSGRELVSRASHIFRARPDGSSRDIVLTGGMDNPVGLAFTSTGERILSGTFFQIGTPGKRDGLIHAIYGGVYGKDQAAISGHTRTGDLMPIMTHMGPAAPCGSVALRSTTFGPDFADNLFVCYFNLRKISRHQLASDGATYTTTDTDFVTSDHPDFRPVDVLEDADGSLLVVDTGGWYKICCPTSQLAKPDILGGIYRIRKTNTPAPPDPRGLQLPWAKLTPPDLARLLADSRPYVVDRAMHELGKHGAASVAALRAHALASPSPATRRHAIWTLGRIDLPEARTAVRAALADNDASVVQAALHLTSLFRDREAVEPLTRLLSHSNAHLVRLAAEALGRTGDVRALAPLLQAAALLHSSLRTPTGTPSASGERVLEHALIYALIELQQPAALLARLQPDLPPSAARALIVALDQVPHSGLTASHVLPYLTSPIVELKQTAGWIVAHRSDWGTALSSYYTERLASPPTDPTALSELQHQLAQLAKSAEIQTLLADTAVNPRSTHRLLALRAMAAAGLKDTPRRWLDVLATLLASSDDAVARQAIHTLRSLALPKQLPTPLLSSTANVARADNRPADLRLEALAVAPAALSAVEPALFDFLLAHLAPTQPLPVRSNAATILAQAPLTAEQQLALADAVRTVGPLEAPKLLPAFQRQPTEALGRRLLASLVQESPARAGLRPNHLRPVFAKYPASLHVAADTLVASLNTNAARENARVDELLPYSKNGDIRRGQAVFNSPKTACLLCHQSGHAGGKFGPDLTNIGRIRDERELLEAIIFPSATFVRGYEPVLATTSSGETHSGIVRSDTADHLILATGPDSEQRLARAHVTDLQPGTISPMPPGMDAVLAPQELGDLVAFLKSRQ